MPTYFESVISSIRAFPLDQISVARDVLMDAYRRRAQVFTIGNGGSATTAVHFAGDLNKTTITDRSALRFRARSLAENTAQVTAWANDQDYADVFKEQLVNFLDSGDVLFAISGSGNSANILRAAQYANENGATTIGLCGFDGGQLGRLAQVPIICRNDNMLAVEDLHSVICHFLTSELGGLMKSS